MTVQNERFKPSDYLAVQRTKLAAERTFLAYIRTAVALFATGFGLLKYLGDPADFTSFGFLLMCIAPVVLVVGCIRLFCVCRQIAAMNA